MGRNIPDPVVPSSQGSPLREGAGSTSDEVARPRSREDLLPIRLPEGSRRAGRSRSVGHRAFGLLNVLVLIGGVTVLAGFYIEQYREIRTLSELEKEGLARREAAEERYRKLLEEVEYYETLEGAEKLARDKLRFISPDEVILIPYQPRP